MTYVTARRATRAAKAALVICTAVSCSVYDESLLGSGTSGAGGTAAGHSGTAGEGDSGAGHSGSAGKPVTNGGSSGESSGEGGMMEAAGTMEAGGEGPEGGTSGTSGNGGKAGMAGTAGSTAGGGTAGAGTGGGGAGGGTGGTGGATAGSAGAGGSPTATGCAKLTVPLDDAADRAHFVISLNSAADLSSATTGIVSMRLYVQAGAAGTVFNYVQDSGFRYFGVTTSSRPLLKSISGWQTLTFKVGEQTATGGIVKTDIRRIGIEINAAPDTVGWSNPTIVYIDSITVASPALSFTFDTASTVNTTPMGSDLAGQVMWQHNGTSDTTAAGVVLAWQATCP